MFSFLSFRDTIGLRSGARPGTKLWIVGESITVMAFHEEYLASVGISALVVRV
jgi:hypothetical protein